MPRKIVQTIGGGVGGGVAPWFVEDFSTYSDIANYLTDPRGIYDATNDKNTDRMSFVAASPPAIGSPRALRYTWPARTSEVKDYTIGRALDLPTPTRDDIWIETWWRYSSDFRTGAPNKGYCKVRNVVGTFQDGERITFGGGANVPMYRYRAAHNDMIIRPDASPRPQLDETITGDTSGATAIVDSANYVTEPGPNPDYKAQFIRVDSKTGSDTLPTGRFSYLIGNAARNHMMGYPELLDEPSFGGAANYWDGQWHRWRFHARCNPQGQPDSFQATYVCWIDDAELHDFGVIDCDRRMYGIAMGRNMNVGTDDEITLDWGAIRVWNVDPGWGF